MAALATLSASRLAAQQSVLPDAYADLAGVRLHYVDSGGAGQAVVFLHAATGHSASWEHQAPALKAAGYRLIAYDRRGWGRTISTAAPEESPVPAVTSTDDLLNLVNHLGIDRFHLAGTAAGGFVALDFALSYPQRLRSLVIANSLTSVQDASYQQLIRGLRPPQFDTLPPEFRELGPSYRASNASGVARWLAIEKLARPEGPRAPAQPLKNAATLASLEQIRVPTLVLTGGADLYAPPPTMRAIANRIKGSEFTVVPEAGHSAFWEQPEQFNQTLLRFFRKHQGK